MNIVAQFANMQTDRKSLIRKALDSSAGVGAALIPQKLEKIITNAAVRLSPEFAVIEPEYDAQKLHEFNRLTALPAAGGAMGEGATTPIRNATYVRDSVTLKVVRRKGTVTNFLQDASKNYIDAAAAEMENHLQAHVYDLNTYNLWGSAGANPYAWDGLDTLITTNRILEAVGGTVPTTLKFLDDMIDRNMRKQGAPHKKVFLVSPEMQSLISRLLTNVRIQQGTGAGVGEVNIKGGWRLETYRNIPILPTAAMSPGGKMGALGTATAATGGTVADATYYFRVAYVDWNGESEASDEASQAATGGNTSTVTVTFTAVSGALFYKIYCSTDTGTEKLVAIVPANVYDSSGNISTAVTSITFTTTPSTRNPTMSTTGLTAITASVPLLLANDVPYVATGSVRPETVVLWDLDKYQGLGKFPYTNQGGSRFNGVITMEMLARTDDNIPFLIKTYGSACPSFEATSVIHRGLRTA